MAKYDKNIVEKICKLIETDSYTIAEICQKARISIETFYAWQNTKPEFSEAVKKARGRFDELIANEARRSLVKLIRGYTTQEQKTVTDGQGLVKETTVTEKHIAPNPTSIIFALTNRDPDNWKNRRETEVRADVCVKSKLEDLSDEELQKLIDGEKG